MDILYRRKQATAAQVLESMPDPPGYSAVRTLLATLENKGYVRHSRDGAKYVYVPVVHHGKASRSAIAHLIHTFFEGSRGRAAAALLDVAPSQFTQTELDRFQATCSRDGGNLRSYHRPFTCSITRRNGYRHKYRNRYRCRRCH